MNAFIHLLEPVPLLRGAMRVGARPALTWGIHEALVASVRVFDSLKDAMAVYGGFGGKRMKKECCETGIRWNVRHCRRRVYETGPHSKEDLP